MSAPCYYDGELCKSSVSPAPRSCWGNEKWCDRYPTKNEKTNEIKPKKVEEKTMSRQEFENSLNCYLATGIVIEYLTVAFLTFFGFCKVLIIYNHWLEYLFFLFMSLFITIFPVTILNRNSGYVIDTEVKNYPNSRSKYY